MRVKSWSSRLLSVLVAVSAVAACDDPAEPPDDDTGETCETEPTLSSLKATYFATSCALSACHRAGPVSKNGGLDLFSEGVHARLVGVTPHNVMAAGAGKKIVLAGDAENSFMVQKVEGRIVHQTGTGASLVINEGEWMPNGTDEVVDPECWVKQLRAWIDAGAEDN